MSYCVHYKVMKFVSHELLRAVQGSATGLVMGFAA
jgi:hypothetical protein